MTPAEAAQHLEAGAETVRNRLADPDRVTVNHVVKPLILLGLLVAAATVWLLSTVGRIRRNRRAGQAAPKQDGIRVSWRSVLMFVGPATLLYTIFVIVPCLKSFAWSTQRWNGLTEMAYVGLLHFKRLLLESDGFWTALKNNLFIMLVVPLFVLPLSLFFAACISRRIRLSGLFRIVFFFPNVLGGGAATLLWMHMYHPDGPIGFALANVGRGFSWLGFEFLGAPLEAFAGFAWLSQDHLYWALIPMAVWGACGFNMILFLAAMESIPQTLYEAADIDGASAWRQFRTITLPLIWDVLAIAIVFMVIGGMKTFEVIWLLTNQGPTTETHVIGTRMVQAMFSEFKVGEATAIAVLLFLMVFFGTIATLRVMRRERVEF
jgi:ABC-type sugar transport system permease subunit